MTANKRLDKTDMKILALSALLFAAAVSAFLLCGYAFGSSLDWSSQHYALPDMFRTLFYDTGELFPSFAPNIGAGENIYYFSYYGLLSPVILLSYALPFVKMSVYIQVSSAVLCWLGGALFYRFMRKYLPRRRAVLLMICYFVLPPVFLHAHRHIMFISYMPFLILAMEAADSFLESRRGGIRLTLFSFLIVMTSWFFSVSALAALTVYAVYRYLSLRGTFDLKDFVKTALAYALRIAAAVLMAGVLLLPTLSVLLSGRDESNTAFTAADLIPGLRFDTFGFTPYSPGLGMFGVFAVVTAVLMRDKAKRFMGIALAAVCFLPVMVYALNGTLYIDGKVLIPFIPLLLICCSHALDRIKEQGPDKRALIITAALFVSGLIFSDTTEWLRFDMIGMAIDFALLAGAAAFYMVKHREAVFAVSLIALPALAGLVLNITDPHLTAEDYTETDSSAFTELARQLPQEGNIYRSAVADHRVDTPNTVPSADFLSPYVYSSVHHKGYNDFYFKEMNNENEYRNSALTTRSQNPMFAAFIGEKYLFSRSETAPFGYEELASDGELHLYASQFAQPLGRVKPQLGEDVFDKLSAPEKMEALLRYTVTGSGGSFESSVQELGTVRLPESRSVRFENGLWHISTAQPFTAELTLPFDIPEDRLLVLETVCDNDLGDRKDARVAIGGVANKLTSPLWKYYNNNTDFTYVLKPDGRTLSIRFGAGEYTLTELRASSILHPLYCPGTDELILDRDRTKGSVMYGTIECTAEGFFELAVPNDKGFALTVDGAEQEITTVGKTFIGCRMSAGTHTVELRFEAPMLGTGKAVSLAGLALFAALIVYDLLRRRQDRNN
ncbi:MAG: YfhO family protein [Ruminococcus sp.]|nr:YfhO family protein [Ruminococcus sp.]